MNPTTVADWLGLITLGGLAGMLGQGARVIVGLKKAQDAASAMNRDLSSMLDMSRLVVSLIIGFIAGAIAAIQMHGSINEAQILAYVAIGYIGADFIEGFIRRTQPSESGAGARAETTTSTATSSTTSTTTANTTPATNTTTTTNTTTPTTDGAG